MTCKTCKHWFDNGTDLSSCDRDALLREADFFCAAWEEEPILRVETHHVKPTNGDVIRGMTDEELDEFLNEVQGDAYLVGFHQSAESHFTPYGKCWLDWLKAPVEEVQDD